MKTEVMVGVWEDGANTETDSPVLLVLSDNGETEIQSFAVKGQDGQDERLSDYKLEEIAAIAYDALKQCANDVATMPLTREEPNEIQSEDCGTDSVPETSELDAD